jgi:outer membrane lipoprotein LolB
MRRLAQGPVWLVAAAFWLGGCASTPRGAEPADPTAGPWSGRLALRVADRPDQSFSAAFELRGQAPAGVLTLYTPLGGTAAVLSWAPGTATLNANGEVRQYESVDALVAQATGSPLPVAALFDWLAGRNVAVPGWQADLSLLGEGRLRAQRLAPPPEADLRVVLDR